VATLVRYTGPSERTVRTCLNAWRPSASSPACDPDIVAARIKRADRRPQGWDLNLSRVRHDLDDADLAVLERRSSAPGPSVGWLLREPLRDLGAEGWGTCSGW
jgi:hypothetical protein